MNETADPILHLFGVSKLWELITEKKSSFLVREEISNSDRTPKRQPMDKTDLEHPYAGVDELLSISGIIKRE